MKKEKRSVCLVLNQNETNILKPVLEWQIAAYKRSKEETNFDYEQSPNYSFFNNLLWKMNNNSGVVVIDSEDFNYNPNTILLLACLISIESESKDKEQEKEYKALEERFHAYKNSLKASV